MLGMSSALTWRSALGDLDFIQHQTDLFGSEMRMIQELAKAVEGALEINVVFPQRVVGIDDQVAPAIFHMEGGHFPCPLLGASTRICWLCLWREV
jgi:hypothetical protein